MDITQVTNIINKGIQDRVDTFILSDYFLFMNHQRYPLTFIQPLIKTFLPEYYSSLSQVFLSLSEIKISPKQYNNMSLSAKQAICALYIGRVSNTSHHEIYLSILAIVGRFCEIHKDTQNDGATMELQAMDNFFSKYAPKNLSQEDKRLIWDLAVSINPSHRKEPSNNPLINNMSDAVVMPTYGISWELFHNDMIRIERETMVLVDAERSLLYLKNYFQHGWLGVLSETPFKNFPNRLMEQLSNDK